MSTHAAAGSPRGRTMVSVGLALALALTAALAAPVASAGSADGTLNVGLAFSAQPTDAEVGEVISTQPFGGAGADPVSVKVTVTAQSLDDAVSGLRGPSRRYQEQIRDVLGEGVTLRLASADGRLHDDDLAVVPDQVSLSPDAEGGLQGVVAFEHLKVRTAVRGAALDAALPDGMITIPGQGGNGPFDIELSARSQVSDRFTVWQNAAGCVAGSPCTAELGHDMDEDSHQGLHVELTSDSTQGFLAMTFTDEDLEPGGGSAVATCDGQEYVSIPGPVLFDGLDLHESVDELIATVRIDKAAVQEDVSNGRAHYDICYVGDKSFTAKSGVPAPQRDGEAGDFDDPLEFGPALLPHCRDHDKAPCVQSRTGFRGGGAEIVVRLPAGDPIMR